jgi:hypothetical protein
VRIANPAGLADEVGALFQDDLASQMGQRAKEFMDGIGDPTEEVLGIFEEFLGQDVVAHKGPTHA